MQSSAEPSNCGLTSGFILRLADHQDMRFALDVRPGRALDAPPLAPILKQTMARRERIDAMAGDKAFDESAKRRACQLIGTMAVIPAKSNRFAPKPLDEAADRERNRGEWLFAKPKEFLHLATRYEKLN